MWVYSVHVVNFLSIVCFENKIDHIYTAYIQSILVMHSSSSHCSQPLHFKFVIVAAIEGFISEEMKFLYKMQHFYCFYLEVYSKSSEFLLRDWNVKWKCLIFYVTYLCDQFIQNY